ncbi:MULTISPECIES: hypothetical protein [Acidianus]|uniref:Uncharacterized protein n=1 Tax=Candidatus Acidianus copahuensis TaxID=1160895 RepID=A0A031LN32_9CREN|nr:MULTISPECIES: hypothetical protein [Acidianus]EZQ04800.1 hypothetical protein CM19_07385 [Candidatus Acidianus copahuensis]NON61203.1 hypothetical protein [Acidianus sp. RZ1]
MSEEYFLKYNGDQVFVVLLGYSGNKTYLYYPKGDAIFIVSDDGVSLKEIDQVIGSAPAGFKLSEPKEIWDKIKSRQVTWYIEGKEVVSDNVYVVTKSEIGYKKAEEFSPNRLKYYILKEQNPWDYANWCCVLIVSKNDVQNLPSSFTKITID